MKHFLFMMTVLLGCVVTSCSNTDVVALSNNATRSDQAQLVDLRDFGVVHNMIMDFGQARMANSKDLRAYGDVEFIKTDLNSAVKDNMSNFMLNTSLSGLSEKMIVYMDDYMEYYGEDIEDHFLDPIDENELNGKIVDGITILEQASNCGVLNEDEYDFLKKISIIAIDADSKIPLNEIKNRLQEILLAWNTKYGDEKNFAPESNGLLSGVCIQIGIYSCDWWEFSYGNQQTDGPQRIAPWVAYLVGRDVKGAVRGTLKYVIKSYIRGSDLTWSDAGSAALVGGVKSSLGGLFR